MQSLPIVERLINLQPKNTDWLKKKILVLNEIGASHLAYQLAVQNPGLISAEELARIKADKAAHRLRWSGIQAPVLAERFNETDQAISELTQNIRSFTANLGPNHPITRNEQFDLLVALRQRVKMQDVLSLHETLAEEGVSIPAYAKNAVCDAWLYINQPSNAADCYESVLEEQPNNVNSQVALFYAYLEDERYNKALRWIQRVSANQPVTIQGNGQKKIIAPNYKKEQTDVNKSLAVAFGDDLDKAHQILRQFHQIAPNNISIRKELANLYYWRGWPEKAQEEYDIGLHQHPDDLGLQLGLARNHLALKKYTHTEALIQQLYQDFP
ncbi:MAG: tetratricopeptide repeat protein, partial [Pseudomonadales bacterium]